MGPSVFPGTKGWSADKSRNKRGAKEADKIKGRKTGAGHCLGDKGQRHEGVGVAGCTGEGLGEGSDKGENYLREGSRKGGN